MNVKKLHIVLLIFLFLLPHVNFSSDIPSSVVFKNYKENVHVLKNNKALILITFTSANPISETLLLPLDLEFSQITSVKTTSINTIVSTRKLDGQVYISIEPSPSKVIDKNPISIEINVQNYVVEDGLLFKNMTIQIPLISNYSIQDKSNVFIDKYETEIEIPESYNLSNFNQIDANNVYRLKSDNTSLSKEGGKIIFTSNYLNLHSIEKLSIHFTTSFNPIILLGIIFVLLALYLVYFLNLLKFEE